MADIKTKPKIPMEKINIAELNRGQSSKLIRGLAEDDKVVKILKHSKTIAVVMSYERYKCLLEKDIDINEF
ncbi:type II toxin-antitoxin system Phd/YefM family antitoxin [Lacrimispora sp.]|uniref:type II toxin-antitoxin system Phd/YefM family antitoxin n=1 Tax=Lacrimispora sp. TaxID=2719234 RepID=UPI002FD90840